MDTDMGEKAKYNIRCTRCTYLANWFCFSKNTTHIVWSVKVKIKANVKINYKKYIISRISVCIFTFGTWFFSHAIDVKLLKICSQSLIHSILPPKSHQSHPLLRTETVIICVTLSSDPKNLPTFIPGFHISLVASWEHSLGKPF